MKIIYFILFAIGWFFISDVILFFIKKLVKKIVSKFKEMVDKA